MPPTIRPRRLAEPPRSTWREPPGGSAVSLDPPTSSAMPQQPLEPWDHHEGYYQQGLLPGTGETIKLQYNPPDAVPLGSTLPNEYGVQPFIPGATPPGYVPVGTPPPGMQEQQYQWWKHLIAGTRKGWGYSVDSKNWGFTRSALWNRAPKEEWAGMNELGKTGYAGGRIAGDALGHGSRSLIWRLHPADLVGTAAMGAINKVGGNRTAQILAMSGGVTALDLASGNINPFNLGDAGRPTGFGPTSPDPDDPLQTTSAPLEYFNRAVLGRTGRLLPWEQFHEERPDVSYDTYANYQEYLRDSGILGLAKGTLDGVDGPEARIMGYRVTPLGALAAAATIGGGVLATKRFAGMRR